MTGGGAGYPMHRTPPSTRSSSPLPVITPVHRASRSTHGLDPEFGLLSKEMTAPTIPGSAVPGGSDSAGMEGATPMQYTLFKPRTPNLFYSAVHEDIEDWLVHYDSVATYNMWDDRDMLRHVYFSLNHGARVLYENRAGVFTSWVDFKQRHLETYGSPDRRERAELELQCCMQMPNEGAAMYVKHMTCPLRRADPNMPEEKDER